MADTVTSKVIYNGHRRYAVSLTNECDGTGESGVTKVDISTLTDGAGKTATYTTIDRIVGHVTGGYVRLHWDHTTDETIEILSGSFDFDYSVEGGKTDGKGSGGTGDILLTTDGFADGDSYDFTIYLRPKAA